MTSKQYVRTLKVADETVAVFTRAQKRPDETISSQYTSILNEEKKNFDKVRAFQMTVANDDFKHYYYGLIPLQHLEEVVSSYNSNLCEILTTFPYKLYFDIDDKECKIDLQYVFDIMKKYFGLTKNDITISGYETEFKHSYHVVAKNLVLRNIDEVTRIKNIVNFLIKHEGITSLDSAVYSKNRLMKCIHQSKPGGTIALPIHPENPKSTHDFFISSFIPKNSKPYFEQGILNKLLEQTLKVNISPRLQITPMELPRDFVWTSNDILKANTDTARKLLSLTPYVSNNKLAHRRKVACFCFANGLSETEFNSWYLNSDPKPTKSIPNVAQWWNPESSNYLSMTYGVSIESFAKYLSQWYPSLILDNPNTGHFINSFDLNIQTTSIERIEPEHFQTNHRVLIFNIGMGGGKTTTTLQELVRVSNQSFVWLAPRQTLVQNTSHRMTTEFELPHITHLDVGADKGKLTKANHLIICNQSLHYLDNKKTYDYVIIDEIETVLLSWLDESTHGKHLKNNFQMFCSIIKNAKKVILLDAFVTTKTLDLLTDLGITTNQIKVYESAYKPSQKNLVFNGTEEQIVDKIVTAVSKKEKCYIFYPFKKPSKKHMGIIEFDSHIKQLVKDKLLSTAKTAEDKLLIHECPPKSLLYFAESKEKNNLGEINILWSEVDYVLTTSSITVGVNYEKKDYHHVFLLASGATNAPRDVIQSSMRIRYPQSSEINYHLYDVKLHDIEKFPSYFHDTDIIYKNLIISNLREIQSGFVDSFYKMCGLTNYKLDIKQEEMYKVKQRKNFINTMYETSNLIEYSKVPIVTDEEKIQKLQTSMYTRCADMVDRLIVERYYFDIKFRNLDVDERAHIWNTNRKEFFNGITSEFIGMVEKDNNVSRIVDINPRKFNVSKQTLEYVLQNYSIIKGKKVDSKVIQVLNNILGFEAFRIKTDKSKHAIVVISEGAKRLYAYHRKKLQLDAEEKLREENDFISEQKSELTKSEWISKWYSKLSEQDFIKVQSDLDIGTDIYTTVCKHELPWVLNPDTFHLQTI